MQRRRLPALLTALAASVLGLTLFFLLWSPKGSTAVAEVGATPTVTPNETDENLATTFSAPNSIGLGRENRVGSLADPSISPDSRGTVLSPVDQPGDQEPLFRLSARFVDGTGQPVPDVRVLLQTNFNGAPLAVADELGSLDRAPIWNHQIHPEGDPFPRFSALDLVYVAPGFVQAGNRINYIPGSVLHLGTVPLRSGGRVTGKVIDSNGEPVQGVRSGLHVSLFAPNANNPIQVGMEIYGHSEQLPSVWGLGGGIDESGSFSVMGVESQQKFVAAVMQWEQVLAISLPQQMTLGQAELVIDFQLTEPLCVDWIAGRVLLPNGEAAAGASVYSAAPKQNRPSEETYGVPARTDSEGRFLLHLFSNPMPAIVRVIAYTHEGAYQSVSRSDIPLGTSDLTLTLGPEKWFQLSIVDPDGMPIAWSNVRLSVPYGCPGGMEHSELQAGGESGVIRLPLPPCIYSLQVFAPGYAPLAKSVNPIPEENAEISVTLQPAASIRGRILSGGDPVSGAMVGILQGFADDRARVGNVRTIDQIPFLSWVKAPQDRHDATSASDGSFEAQAHFGGRLHLLVQAPGFPRTVGEAFVFDEEDGALVSMDLERAGRIDGTVAGLKPSQYPDYLIGATDGHGLLRIAPIDESGAWSLEGLQPGHWQVHAISPPAPDGQTIAAFSPIDQVNWPQKEIVVRPDQTSKTQVVFDDPETCVIQGHLILTGPDSVTQIPPGAVAVLAAGTAESSSNAGAQQATLDSNGFFRLTTPRPGTYVLTIKSQTYQLHWGVLEVHPGDLELEMVLELAEQPILFSTTNRQEVSALELPYFYTLYAATQTGHGFSFRFYRSDRFYPSEARFDSESGHFAPCAVGQALIGPQMRPAPDFLREPTRLPDLPDTVWIGSVQKGTNQAIEVE